MRSYILKADYGFDSKIGCDYVVLNKNYGFQNAIQYCINNNCNGFVRVGSGKYWVRPPKFSAYELEASKIYRKNKYKNIALYTLRY